MATLESVLKDFENRIAALEQAFQKGQPNSGIKPSHSDHYIPSPPIPKNDFKLKVERPKTDSAPMLLGIVGIVFLILAGAFFVKLTIDSGWLTPLRQLFIAGVIGFVFLILPHFVESLRDSYGSLLTGTGVVVLHLTWFGAFQIHHLIEVNAALIFASLVGVLAIFINSRLGNSVFVLVAIAGTYLAAPLVGYSGPLGTVSIFIILWNLSFSLLAIESKRRDILLVAAYFAFFTSGILMLARHSLSDASVATELLGLQIIQFLIFAATSIFFTLRHESPMTKEQGWALFPLLLVFYSLTDSLLKTVFPNVQPFYGIIVGLILLGTYQVVSNRSRSELSSGPSILAFALLTIAHSGYFTLAPETSQPFISLFIAFASFYLFGRQILNSSNEWKPALLIVGGVAVYGMLQVFDPKLSLEMRIPLHLGWAVLALSIATRVATSSRSLVLAFAHFQVLFGLYQLSLYQDLGSIFVTVSWGTYAIAILFWGLILKSQEIGRSAVVILVAVSFKAAFHDVWGADNGKRILSLFIAGALLYGCGWIYGKVKSWA